MNRYIQPELSCCAEEGGTLPAAHAASYPLNDHRAQRAERITYTSTGIGIGSHYIAPPPPPGSEAERIQSALLRHSAETMWDDEKSPWVWLAYSAGLFGALLVAHLCARCTS